MQSLVNDVALLHTVYDRQQCQPIDISALITAALESSADVQVELGELPPVMVAHKQALLRVFRNIFENAAKYAADANGVARVHVSGSTTDTHWQLQINDRGPGISEAELPHVFDPFYRGAERSNPDGSGLGLAIVHACAKAHGGTARVSNLDEGGLGIQITILKST